MYNGTVRVQILLHVALIPLCVIGIRLQNDLPNRYEGDATQQKDNAMQGSSNSSEYSDASNEHEDEYVVQTMLGAFEEDAEIYSRALDPRREQSIALQKVAVVAVGHVRTFILPGVHSSVKANLLGTYPGIADYFFVGHMGRYMANMGKYGGKTVHTEPYLNSNFNGSEEKALIFALNKLQNYSKHVEIHAGSACDDLLIARMEFGTTGPPCDSANKNLMQVLWMDHAFKQTNKFGPYVLIFRIRPDVAVFKPFPWEALSTETINYVQKRTFRDGVADWHFAFPFLYVNKTWPSVVSKFFRRSQPGGFHGVDFSGDGYSPDMVWKFPAPFANHGNEVNFPSVVVRSASTANCGHIKDDVLHDFCELAARTNYFMQEH